MLEVLTSLILIKPSVDFKIIKSYRVPLHGYEPIPLTPEILSTNGFKFKRCGISGADNWQGMDFWTHDKIRLRGTVSTARGGMLHLEGYFNSQITYVHQLQNLTHALTQTELQIQL